MMVVFETAVLNINSNILAGYEDVNFQYPVLTLKPIGEKKVVHMIKQTHFYFNFLLRLMIFILKFKLERKTIKSAIFAQFPLSRLLEQPSCFYASFLMCR